MLLAVDTSGPCTSVAVARNGVIETLDGEHGHEYLAELTEAILDKSRTKWSEIELLLIGSGPGSFTGLRMGYAFLKGVSTARRVPLRSIPSFIGAARAAAVNKPCDVLVLADARRGEYFNSVVRIMPESSEILSPDEIISSGAITDLIGQFAERAGSVGHETLITGYGIDASSIGALRVSPWNNVAWGLVQEWTVLKNASVKFDLAGLAAEAPHYVRTVSAKTVEERLQAKFPPIG